MSHLTPDQLSALVDDALQGSELEQARGHLGECHECRTALAELQSQDDALFAARADMPGDEYFASFAERVQDRIVTRESGSAATPVDSSRPVEGAPPPRSDSAPWWSGLFGWLQSPGRVAWAGGVAVVVVGAGIAFMTARETNVAAFRSSEVGQAMDQALRDDATSNEAGRQNVPPAADAPAAEGRVEADDRASGAREDAALPSRAREVRRTESGEEVPVDRDVPRFAQEPIEEAAPPASPGEATFVRKPRTASPLAGQALAESEEKAKQTAKKEATADLALQSKVAGNEVCGQVHDAANRPLVGAQVVIAERGITATTDADGKFCLDAPSGAQTLTVMAVGFETLRQSVEVGAANEPLAMKLDAVDVLGKSSASGSASALTPSALSRGGAKPAFDEDALRIPEDAAVAMREAQRLTTLAEQDDSAKRWDTAAAAWGKAAGLMPAGPNRMDAMYRTAEARKKAWDMDPNDSRKTNARKAFEDYVKAAPIGDRRDRVSGWLISLQL